MKTNLIIFAKNARLNKQLQGYIDRDKVESTRALLDKYFPSDSIALAHDRLVMEMGDLISSLHEADDINSYLDDLLDTTQQLIARYYQEKKKAISDFTKVNHHCKQNYITMPHKLRAETGYTPDTVKAMLEQLDARDAYQCHVDGYEYERYRAYEWLKHHISESLAGRTHETKIFVTDPFKLANIQEDEMLNT